MEVDREKIASFLRRRLQEQKEIANLGITLVGSQQTEPKQQQQTESSDHDACAHLHVKRKVEADPVAEFSAVAGGFKTPETKIKSYAALEEFQQSPTYNEYLGFILRLNDSVRSKPNSHPCHISPTVDRMQTVLSKMEGWINEIPPRQHRSRFGNESFCTWFDRLHQNIDALMRLAIPDPSEEPSEHKNKKPKAYQENNQNQFENESTNNNNNDHAKHQKSNITVNENVNEKSNETETNNKKFQENEKEIEKKIEREELKQAYEGLIREVGHYLLHSVGNRTRIDYGTGHEAHFVAWMFCFEKIGLLGPDDYTALVLRVFRQYLGLMRRLQVEYWLEPAGSHGVWGLDDYHFLPFLWGAAQLLDHKYIKPRSIRSEETVEGYAKDYMYLACIQFINKVKTGSLGEHSPMLVDISGVREWRKVNEGMIKMYKAELLQKFPVMQHFKFGSLLSFEPTVNQDDADNNNDNNSNNDSNNNANQTAHEHSSHGHCGHGHEDNGPAPDSEFMTGCRCAIRIPSAIASKQMAASSAQLRKPFMGID